MSADRESIMNTRLTIIYRGRRGEHLSTYRQYSAESWDDCVMSAVRDLREFARLGSETEPTPRDIIAAELSDEARAKDIPGVRDGATLIKTFQPSEWIA